MSKERASRVDICLAFSTCVRKAVEADASLFATRSDKDAEWQIRAFLVVSYLRRVAELQESAALGLRHKRYATAFALVRPIYESSLYGMYLAALAPLETVIACLASAARRGPFKLPTSTRNIVAQLGKKKKDFRSLLKGHNKWWAIFCDNSHGAPASLPLSMIGNKSLDPTLEEMLIAHITTPVVLFLAIAQELEFIGVKKEIWKLSAALANTLLKSKPEK